LQSVIASGAWQSVEDIAKYARKAGIFTSLPNANRITAKKL